MTRLVVIWMLFSFPVFANTISAGVKVGVPLTEIVQTAGEIGDLPFEANVNRFALGPVLQVRFPSGLGIEFGAIYKRFRQQAGQVQIIFEPGMSQGVVVSPYSQTGRSWEFPIVGQFRLPGGAVRPYFEAGVAFNRLSGVFGPFRTLVNVSRTLRPTGRSESRTGFVAGAGLEFKLPLFRVSPGIRYTHYGEARLWLPRADSTDSFIGLTF